METDANRLESDDALFIREGCGPEQLGVTGLHRLVMEQKMLNIQEALHNLIHRPIYESQSQVTERVVGQTLLEGAKQSPPMTPGYPSISSSGKMRAWDAASQHIQLANKWTRLTVLPFDSFKRRGGGIGRTNASARCRLSTLGPTVFHLLGSVG
ncbi:hypothetical protein INR49_025671 [Caranx melampygus]|nr:hypothetical protein INR49_025671 [Caranx melampygus]